MFKNIPLDKFYRLINHGPTVLITSAADGKVNIAPVAWTTPINDGPPLLGLPIAENHFTTELIRKSREFVVNVPGEELLPAILHAGKSSGRNENKFKMTDLSPVDGVRVAVPHIAECAGYLECVVKEEHAYDGVVLFIAEVVHAQADEDKFDDYWISEKARTVHHLGGGYFIVSGKRFKAR